LSSGMAVGVERSDVPVVCDRDSGMAGPEVCDRDIGTAVQPHVHARSSVV
jgi:hypothetical protein